ncbi:uncharacterized protein PGTG_04684 [Puccinia graminis f. sp. tritici CRL 75-36-700-3]|uniref:Phospholipase A-2-activating protein n=1 Tax=Puccinia graminis f. sp. tritici (strain CRL 75-36-700-3 / race SCCL) TaxID=418459 RepID=E3K3S6_PUCGT|nr:uncharacterized protein PGTG_04684 [Puccinia graminis f. sp. tritici CRL 75-36-700-3]EFP78728.2 hypothetical protein PGTG_04684 [Puccinia graminis f. sp. tritici CRL 75-36-700-3]
MSNKPFKLSATLVGHSQDVKSVKFVKPDSIFSCARDTTARVWKRSDEQWSEQLVYQNSNPGFLNAIAAITIKDKEYIISAGQDALLQLWPLHPESDQSYAPEFVLAGHTSNVCCLDVYDAGPGQQPTICSGSWDCSAIVWRDNNAVYNLRGHSAAVWAVLGLGDADDSVLTAGADNLIMLWKKGKQALTFKGHTQAVRALAKLPQNPQLFASAGNDATVRVWNLDGQAVRVMDGHDSFIYSLSSMPSGEIVSSGEDRTVRIWDPSSGQLTQTVTVPAISVWTVSANPENGDIVCGSSDNMIRVFTRSEERLASSSELSKFEESVKTSSVPSATVGDVKKSDLPSVAVLLSRRGKKEGEVAMAKNESNGAVEAYQWDGMKGDWSMVGTVVDGIGSARKQLFEGKEYDYVFDVDIKDGEPPLKLPYNASDNPYTVAQKWLAKHELPDTYVDQVVDFIDKNTSGVALGGPTAGADPFTGSASYRPNPGQNQTQSNVGADPFTGAGSYRPNSGAPSVVVTGKIKEFSSQLGGKELSPTELKALSSLTTYLSKVSGAPPESGIKVLEKMMVDWPPAKQFPAIDIVRTMSISVLSAQLLPCLLAKIRELDDQPGTELNFTLAVRALSNGLTSCPITTSQPTLINKPDLAKQICDLLSSESSPKLNLTTKNAKVAFATLLLNLSILCVDGILDSDAVAQLLALTGQFVSAEAEEEAVYRSLIGLGNMVSSQKTSGLLTSEAKSKIATLLSYVQGGRTGPNRLSDAIKEISTLIK